MKTLDAIKHLQGLLAKRFGKGYSSECGEATIYVSPDKIDMTDLHGHIEARGPSQVVRVLRRKRRAK